MSMVTKFEQAMMKLAVVGQDVSQLVDCSELIPEPKPAAKQQATFPAGTSPDEIQQACASPFPVLQVDGK